MADRMRSNLARPSLTSIARGCLAVLALSVFADLGCATSTDDVLPGGGSAGGDPDASSDAPKSDAHADGAGGAAGSGGAGGAGGATGCQYANDCAFLNEGCAKGTCNAQHQCEKQSLADGDACIETNKCTSGATCKSGVCSGGTAKDCSPLTDQCHTGACDVTTGNCTSLPKTDGTACDDNSVCTTGDACMGGICLGGSIKDCTALDQLPCVVGTCNVATGACEAKNAPATTSCSVAGNDCKVGTCDSGSCKAADAPDGTGCTLATPGDCIQGSCTAGACEPVPVPDGDACNAATTPPCMAGTCNGGTCALKPVTNGDSCEDGDPCTVQDVCVNGACLTGMPKDCSGVAAPCTDGVCNATTGACEPKPRADGAACDDDNVCTTNDVCTAGACAGADGPDGTACSDGWTCSASDVCTAGKCAGTPSTTVFLRETFANNAAGWTLDAEWQIGPAKESSCSYGYEDPALDHTPTADNGVAGVVIGGCPDTSTGHSFRYLTSPAFDTSAATNVTLSFYRMMSSDWDPDMVDTIDVFDGASWKPVWTTANDYPPSDSGWTFEQYDLSSHKSKTTKVRFGFSVTSYAYSYSSWSIDDVTVAAKACP